MARVHPGPAAPAPERGRSGDGQRHLHHIVEGGLPLLRGGHRARLYEVGDGADAERLLAGARGVGIEGGGLHLHGEHAELAPLERAGDAGLAVKAVGGEQVAHAVAQAPARALGGGGAEQAVIRDGRKGAAGDELAGIV